LISVFRFRIRANWRKVAVIWSEAFRKNGAVISRLQQSTVFSATEMSFPFARRKYERNERAIYPIRESERKGFSKGIVVPLGKGKEGKNKKYSAYVKYALYVF